MSHLAERESRRPCESGLTYGTGWDLATHFHQAGKSIDQKRNEKHQNTKCEEEDRLTLYSFIFFCHHLLFCSSGSLDTPEFADSNCLSKL